MNSYHFGAASNRATAETENDELWQILQLQQLPKSRMFGFGVAIRRRLSEQVNHCALQY